MLQDRLNLVVERMRQACRRCGRDPSSVTLVAVTKGVSPELMREAIRCQASIFGENRVQEAAEKRTALAGERVMWHLIGHLQRNKAKRAAELFDIIQSVDSLELIRDLDRHATQSGRSLSVMLQVNVSGEATKSGCHPEELEGLARAVIAAKSLRFVGLMTMAPFVEDPEQARPCFRKLRELRDRLQQTLRRQPVALSMGMSNDFEVAIEEGADLVRIGTAIFRPETADRRPET